MKAMRKAAEEAVRKLEALRDDKKRIIDVLGNIAAADSIRMREAHTHRILAAEEAVRKLEAFRDDKKRIIDVLANIAAADSIRMREAHTHRIPG